MNVYLVISIVIFLIFIIYINKSKFTFIPGIPKNSPKTVSYDTLEEPVQLEPNVYLQDTRTKYPTLPPVNPNVLKSILKKKITASPDLYFTQDYSSENALIDSPNVESSNELYYSGGTNELIKIPLQYIDDQEQLRSQKILITPYNRIKYANNSESCQEA